MVAHTSAGGLGLYVEHMPDGALQALHAAALATAAIPSALQQSVDPVQGKAMHQECSNLFRNFLDAVLQDFFSQAPVNLTEASYELSNFMERSRYVQGGHLLTQGRIQLQEEFFNTISKHIQRIGQPEDDVQDSEETDTGLSLIGEDEFQDWLNLSGAINEVELAVTNQLAEFERRFSLLMGASLERKRNPYAPELICRNFQDTIQFLKFSNAMRAILYRTFSHALAHHSLSLYELLNKVLASLQPATPPKRKTSGVKPGPPAPRDHVDEPRSEPAEIADTLNNGNPQRQSEAIAGIAPAPESAEYSLDRILASINQPARSLGGQASFLPADPYSRGRSAGGWAPAFPGHRPYPIEMAGWLQQTSRRMEDGRPAEGGGGRQRVMAGGQSEGTARRAQFLTPPPGAVSGWRAVSRSERPGGGVAHLGRAGGNPMRIAAPYRQTLDMASGLIGRARAEYVANSEAQSVK